MGSALLSLHFWNCESWYALEDFLLHDVSMSSIAFSESCCSLYRPLRIFHTATCSWRTTSAIDCGWVGWIRFLSWGNNSSGKSLHVSSIVRYHGCVFHTGTTTIRSTPCCQLGREPFPPSSTMDWHTPFRPACPGHCEDICGYCLWIWPPVPKGWKLGGQTVGKEVHRLPVVPVCGWSHLGNQAPSPALRISNTVSYIHEEPWQSQIHSFADFVQRTIKWYVDFKTSSFFAQFDTDFFSVAVNVKHGFLSYETLTECTWLQHRWT